jgi:hypothetical protein
MVCGLGDQHNHGQVVEEFKGADHALVRLLAMRARRLPQGTAQPVQPLAASYPAGPRWTSPSRPGNLSALA